jgi:hypothetical protein
LSSHVRCAGEHRWNDPQKKEQGASPALKIVSTLFPRKVGFDLN